MPLDACGCAVRRRSVGDLVSHPIHAGDVREAPLRGQASRPDRLVVWLGLWPGAPGAPTRARFKAATCASLLAFAELTCELLEDGAAPETIDGYRARMLALFESLREFARARRMTYVRALTDEPIEAVLRRVVDRRVEA